MTREEARKAAEVMLAYADGKEVEFLDPLGNWRSDTIPAFNWFNFNYRIKKEPSYRPFKNKKEPSYRPFKNKKECWAEMQKHQPFGWMKYKSGEAFYIVAIGNGNDFIRAYENLIFDDGTPFGIKEE